MKTTVVVDTNVAVVASSRTKQASHACQLNCVHAIEQAVEGIVVLDESSLILDEYRRNLSPSGQPGVGDAFFRWVWQNQANPHVCERVPITVLPNDRRGFLQFPDDPDLKGFDPDDRKFVAVALTSANEPEVLNATDTDWRDFQVPLERNGVKIKFLCPDIV